MNVAWSERRSIVGEVETQIFELLARRGDAPSREDVVAVLDSLDPPDSYISEELRERLTDAPGTKPEPEAPRWPLRSIRQAGRFVSALGRIAAVVVINVFIVAIIHATDGVIPWLITLAGLAWLNYEAVRWFRAARRRGATLNDFRHNLAEWIQPKNSAQPA